MHQLATLPQPYGVVTEDTEVTEVMDLDGEVMDLDGEVTVDGEVVVLDGVTVRGGRGRGRW
jgi:hypothetical protein